MTLLQALILSIIEGLTEFLPISSTGHMVIASQFMGIEENPFVKNFEVIIQFAAILSVILLYRKRFFPLKNQISFYKKIIIAFIPTAIIGFLFKNKVDEWLESATIVAWTLIIGGIILILSDKWFKNQIENGKTTQEMTNMQSFKLGFIQSIAIIPGVSRSGATIVGGLFLGMKKIEAAEFSFFLAVPTMAAASGYKMLKLIHTFESSQIPPLLVGCVVSFIIAALSIRFLISFVSKFGFKYFGIYRIILGTFILLTLGR